MLSRRVRSKDSGERDRSDVMTRVVQDGRTLVAITEAAIICIFKFQLTPHLGASYLSTLYTQEIQHLTSEMAQRPTCLKWLSIIVCHGVMSAAAS